MTFNMEIHETDGNARTGVINTVRGEIRTPAFMPVGTAATVKAMKPETVRETGADILLGNTYHLMLRPTAERIHNLGGLHKFMNWDRPILTDSGGFQVMSLAKLRKITEEGVAFQSHIDGSKHMLSPERSMEIQRLLGSNIVMAFDECTPYPATEKETEESMLLSMRWAQRSYDAFHNGSEHAEQNALFGIVQGGVFEHLRHQSVAALKEIDFHGLAIGGLAVGEGQDVMFEVLDFTMPVMPKNKPRYLMGVGKPDDLVGAVERGIDMFDCVMPSRSGRTGQAFTRRGTVNMKNARHTDDPRPIDAECKCSACRNYSRAYISHLIRSGEILGPMLLTEHNLTYYQDLMAGMREAISQKKLSEFVEKFHENRALGDIDAV
ncbi:tRNA guanosine(34) transglycosylase Tgt [Pseudemcibacter aquimaris]|uniref:tRNA guanosine(34) transglycosylase Tgt n=1 Tax=Pseudemcibacter aquimaris TaxID=2857064 RepID=UPI0020122E6D|nr:tRNA guanosine(34) transglycosylase Tgt [Pseudemcibacter aquimaris]MCC3860105.1 tRNA guanosine(34) transglycosylase Tgt [Pseudemcibacter aquimaris]WDU57434.1 tRNA guanosine(34) transglycosylase Tgt [Pseudemcibacter aquimaris]